MDEIIKALPRVLVAIAHQLKISSNDRCPCGSGLLMAECCLLSKDIYVFQREFDECIKYRDAMGGHIETVPAGLWKQFYIRSVRRLKCLYQGCENKTSKCHLFPENMIRAVFGNFLSQHLPQDAYREGRFVKIGCGNAGTRYVFCSEHDNLLFKETDLCILSHCSDKEKYYWIYKTVAFQLRKAQELLFINFQLALWETIRKYEAAQKLKSPQDNVINIDLVKEHYDRYSSLYDVYEVMTGNISNENYGLNSYYQRSMKYEGSILYTGVINVSHDLEGERLNTDNDWLLLVCSFHSSGGYLHASLACIDEISSTKYKSLIEQLRSINDEEFKVVINCLITHNVEAVLMPSGSVINSGDYAKMSRSHLMMIRCMQRQSCDVCKLNDKRNAVNFLKKAI